MSDGLLPAAPSLRAVQIDRELPPQARKWGRVLDLSGLEAGDLVLTRLVDPASDAISRAIAHAQEAGGLHPRHAQWTHAAVYLGDDEHVCEANFKIAGHRSGVFIRSVFEYCDGSHAIRARRPRGMSQQQRLRIAIGALTNLGSGYSFLQLWQFYRAASTGSFWESARRGPRIRTRALVCSTLYQDAYNFAFQGSNVRVRSMCTPAHLSASSDFEAADPALGWLDIA
jgi:hypothetical protein